jgi:uncharacterized protein (DUF2147 family)
MLKNSLLVCIVLLAATASVAEEETILGFWVSEEGDARIEVAPCGDKLCGTIVWLREPVDENGKEKLDLENPDESLRDRKVIGLRILDGVAAKPNKKGAWKGGRIYDPKNGKTYRCTLTVDDEGTMHLRGFIGISLLGRTSHWTPYRSP